MAQQTINIGSSELAGDGESLRSAFDKINDNFDEIYAGGIGSGVELTDLNVTSLAAAGNGTLSYDNTTGVFTYTPPDLSSYITDYTVTESDVTAHQAALSITESQISDFGTYATAASIGNSGNWDTAYSWGDHSAAGYATSTYVDTSVANLLDSAPATLDTLNEIAAALGDDPNFSTTITTLIGTKWTEDPTKISNWDTAFSWGNHSTQGYITGYTVTESDVTTHQSALSITESQISDLGTYQPITSVPTDNFGSVGNVEGQIAIDDNYLHYCFQDFTSETTYNFTTQYASGSAVRVLSVDYANWPSYVTAGWQIYRASIPSLKYTILEVTRFNSEVRLVIGSSVSTSLNEAWVAINPGDISIWKSLPWQEFETNFNVTNWNTAYSWGDHSTAGYITGYTVTESDVTTHQSALSITESQISDLTHYTNSDVDAHLNQSNPTSGYVLSWNGTDYAWVANSGGGIALTDLSVTTAAASGTPSLAYDNTTGVFTYTPPDLSGYLESGGALIGSSLEPTATTSGDGDDLTVTGGDATDLNSFGGDAIITGGDGALTDGNVLIGTTQTNAVTIGATGIGTTVGGTLTVNGNATFESGIFEAFSTITGATGTVTHDCDNGHIFYHTSPSANFTANFTNLGLSINYATGVTLVIDQGATARIPSAVQTDGTSRTIVWQGGTPPSGTNNGVDVVSFSILRTSGSYIVLGQLVDFA